MSQPLKSFVEICIYEVKPDKVEEFEELIGRVAKHHREFPGVKDVRYMKRIYRQGSFSSVKRGEPPIKLTRTPKSVTYRLLQFPLRQCVKGIDNQQGRSFSPLNWTLSFIA